MSMLFGIGVSAVCMLIAALLAHRGGMLTPSQMKKTYPDQPKGLTFVWHLAMWFNVVIIGPLATYIIHTFAYEWNFWQVGVSLCCGLIASRLMFGIYKKTNFPDPLAWNGEISPAGQVVCLYMGLAIGVMILFYLFSPNASPRELTAISVLLAGYVTIGNHVLLGLINERRRFWWCPEFLRKADPWITISGTSLLLSIASSYEGGKRACASIVITITLISAIIAAIPLGLKGLRRVPH